jgi:predicted MPP superfamily phosphohydrolase
MSRHRSPRRPRGCKGVPSGRHARAGAAAPRAALRLLGWGAAAGTAAAAYMIFEAQWVKCRQAVLSVPGLPPEWSGLSILHLSDVHAGLFRTNDRSLEKVVRWAATLAPDLVFLTGDVIGDPARSGTCLDMLARLRPVLGIFAVTGNHEYGIGKGPLAHPRDTSALWEQTGITLLRDRCVALPPRGSSRVVLCGADYPSGGFGLLDNAPEKAARSADAPGAGGDHDFPILLIHEPPAPGSPLAQLFPLAFAGHTHGGQLRLPGRDGLAPLNKERSRYLAGAYAWGESLLVVSRGIGTSFVPFRLLTRPEATLWRLV